MMIMMIMMIIMRKRPSSKNKPISEKRPIKGGPKICLNYIITIKEKTKNRRGNKTHKNGDYITTINKGD